MWQSRGCRSNVSRGTIPGLSTARSCQGLKSAQTAPEPSIVVMATSIRHCVQSTQHHVFDDTYLVVSSWEIGEYKVLTSLHQTQQRRLEMMGQKQAMHRYFYVRSKAPEQQMSQPIRYFVNPHP